MSRTSRRTVPASGFLLALLAGLLVLLLPGCAHHVASDADAPWRNARQLVLVTTDGWDAPAGRLQRFERTGDAWRALGTPVVVTVGRNGSGWGLGLHPAQPGLQKREGDGRAPAGVFALGTAFGYAATEATALPYQAMDAGDWCVDVPASPLYNRIVDVTDVGKPAIAESTEPMRRDIHADGDQRYRRGFVIAHNAGNVSGAGSCIFAHLWKAPGEATAGCTAMDDPAMAALLAWLDPNRQPVFVLLPEAEYDRLSSRWRLPAR